MDEAFLELIEEKDFAYITVKEICEKAGVNRSTFYLHYENVGDLLAESARHIIDEFMAYMPHDVTEFFEKLQGRPLEELYLITPEYLTPYLTYIKEHRCVFRVAVEHASTLQMTETYQELSRHVFMPILNRFGVLSGSQKYVMRFHIGGLMAIIDEWLKGDCEDCVEQVIAVMQQCVKRAS